MRTLIVLFATTLTFANAHEGHTPGAIKNGKLIGHDGVTYLDAGGDVKWAKHNLRRKINENSQVIYQFSGEVEHEHSSTKSTESFLEFKAPGGEVLKAFAFDHAGELPETLEILSPDMSYIVEVSRGSDLQVRWGAKHPSSMIKIIIEVRSVSGLLKGRLTASASDDGAFDVPTSLLSQLPEGNAKIAIKRILIGGFHPFEKKDEMLGVRTAVSVVGVARVMN